MLLVLGLSGAPTTDVARVPIEFIELLGIRQSLLPSRNNGLLNMLNLMKRKVPFFCEGTEHGGAPSNGRIPTAKN